MVHGVVRPIITQLHNTVVFVPLQHWMYAVTSTQDLGACGFLGMLIVL